MTRFYKQLISVQEFVALHYTGFSYSYSYRELKQHYCDITSWDWRLGLGSLV